MKICEVTKISRMDSPSSRLKSIGGQAGEFIRWSVALRPTNGETVNSQGAGSAQAPTNPHSNGRIK